MLLFTISNNATTVIMSMFVFLGIAFPGVMTYLTFRRTGRIEKNTDGLVAAALKAKDETSAAKQVASKAEGKAEGIAEKQVEVDQLNKDSEPEKK